MYYWTFWGMHVFWWIFWVLLAVFFFAVLTPVPRAKARLYEDPLSILRRRYARGEITTDEYNERRNVLMSEKDLRTARNEAKAPGTGEPAHGHV